jgi:hypothetical protein
MAIRVFHIQSPSYFKGTWISPSPQFYSNIDIIPYPNSLINRRMKFFRLDPYTDESRRPIVAPYKIEFNGFDVIGQVPVEQPTSL